MGEGEENRCKRPRWKKRERERYDEKRKKRKEREGFLYETLQRKGKRECGAWVKKNKGQ